MLTPESRLIELQKINGKLISNKERKIELSKELEKYTMMLKQLENENIELNKKKSSLEKS